MDYDSLAEDTLSDNSFDSRELKPFACPDCAKDFSKRFNRNRHRETIHRKESESKNDNSPCNEDSMDGDSDNNHTDDGDSVVSEDEGEASEDENSIASVDEEPMVSENEESAVSEDENSIASENEDSVASGDESSIVSGDEESVISDDEESVASENEDEFYPFRDFIEAALACHEEEYYDLADGEDNDEVTYKRSLLKDKISKALRRIFVHYILDMENKKNDPLFKAIMRKAKEFEDDGFDIDEAVNASVSYWKHPINKLLPL